MQYNVINENNCGTTQTLPNRAFYLAKNVPPRLKCSKNIEKVWEAHPQNGESPSSRNVFLKEKKKDVSVEPYKPTKPSILSSQKMFLLG